jgi:competence protein ComEC
MGAAGIVAALADRPRSRWYVLLLAAAVTLALDPRAAADVGWQLSFAAVVGILLLSGPLARLLAGPSPGRARRALAEGAGLTIAATVATAPLMAFTFGTFSVVTLPANLLAVVAEAPVMWLGMLAGGLGQLPWFPVEPVTWLAGLLAAYIAQVAEWFAAPAWAQVELPVAGLPALVGIYAAVGAALFLLLAWTRRRARLRPGRRRGAWAFAAVALAAAALVVPLGAAPPGGPRANPGLVATVLDVGQGDSILLAPANADPVLVDAGPPQADVADALAERGVERLAALVLTHPDSDHSGGAPAVLGRLRVGAVGYPRPTPGLRGAARAAGAATERLAEGATIRSGDLLLRFLWPPPRLEAEPAAREEPNLLSLVAVARWHGFRMLLTGDAEAELAPVHPGDVEVLKVAHHGSEDAGLPTLLAETDPELAVISVGGDNPYGHPAPATWDELRRAGVPVARTDVDGEVSIVVGEHGWSVVTRAGAWQ